MFCHLSGTVVCLLSLYLHSPSFPSAAHRELPSYALGCLPNPKCGAPLRLLSHSLFTEERRYNTLQTNKQMNKPAVREPLFSKLNRELLQPWVHMLTTPWLNLISHRHWKTWSEHLTAQHYDIHLFQHMQGRRPCSLKSEFEIRMWCRHAPCSAQQCMPQSRTEFRDVRKKSSPFPDLAFSMEGSASFGWVLTWKVSEQDPQFHMAETCPGTERMHWSREAASATAEMPISLKKQHWYFEERKGCLD